MKSKTKPSEYSDEAYIEKWLQEEKVLTRTMAIVLALGATFSIVQAQAMQNVFLIILAAYLFYFSTADEKIRAKIMRNLKTKVWLMAVMGIFAIIVLGTILILAMSPDYYLFQIFILVWSGFKSLWDARKIAGFKGTYFNGR